MLEKAIESIVKSIAANDFMVYAERVWRGRFPEEVNAVKVPVK